MSARTDHTCGGRRAYERGHGPWETWAAVRPSLSMQSNEERSEIIDTTLDDERNLYDIGWFNGIGVLCDVNALHQLVKCLMLCHQLLMHMIRWT